MQPVPNMVLNDYPIVIQVALYGKGIALGWNFAPQLLLKSKLLVRPLKEAVSTGGTFFLVVNERRSDQRKLEAMVEWILLQTAGLPEV